MNTPWWFSSFNISHIKWKQEKAYWPVVGARGAKLILGGV